jgi:hypothetical protein
LQDLVRSAGKLDPVFQMHAHFCLLKVLKACLVLTTLTRVFHQFSDFFLHLGAGRLNLEREKVLLLHLDLRCLAQIQDCTVFERPCERRRTLGFLCCLDPARAETLVRCDHFAQRLTFVQLHILHTWVL